MSGLISSQKPPSHHPFSAAAEAIWIPANADAPTRAVEELENGKIVMLPYEPFRLTHEEEAFLNPDCLDPGSKSIKYSPTQRKIWGAAEQHKNSTALAGLMARYADFARDLVNRLLPRYSAALIIGNGSLRPVEVEGRVQSKRHDDRLLHVDSFPSRPTQGKRILRIFANVDPSGKTRHWQVGEPFADVAARFAPRISAPFPGSALLMRLLRITKEKRSPYDHYMLHIHDQMKLDDEYQAAASRSDIHFPAGSTWIAFTDQVSHAALSGQHAMEQTFFLPSDAMRNPLLSPLRVLEALGCPTLRGLTAKGGREG
ncbi:Kdo hydroxylase family protein [Edaphobacter bradus]|uniref:Kdo hydroxylase family protein n=1 Tax=Edaphobacter bradus TaxID=2259016 RepID=UPI0021E0BA90|nr:Kdo hydroxylase family protein [Edaphobacter bradus]